MSASAYVDKESASIVGLPALLLTADKDVDVVGTVSDGAVIEKVFLSNILFSSGRQMDTLFGVVVSSFTLDPVADDVDASTVLPTTVLLAVATFESLTSSLEELLADDSTLPEFSVAPWSLESLLVVLGTVEDISRCSSACFGRFERVSSLSLIAALSLLDELIGAL